MKKIFTLLFTALIAIGFAQAATVTFEPASDTGTFTVGTQGKGSVTKDGVTVAISNGMIHSSGQYRVYKNATLTISSSQNITGIELTATAAGTAQYGIGNFTAGTGTFTTSGTAGSWTGTATSIVFTASAQVRLTKIVVTVEDTQSAVATPTFSVASGTKFATTSPLSVEIACETSGASIYYTTDGTDPTASSTAYTGAITIAATTTLKAIAIKGSDKSNIATATYTAIKSYSTLKELYDNAQVGEEFIFTGNVVVTHKYGASTWLCDNGEGDEDISYFGQIYDNALSDSTFEKGDALAPGWSGKYIIYNGIPEFTNTSGVKTNGKDNLAVFVMDAQEVTTDDVNALVYIENATASEKFASLTWTAADTTGSLLLYNKFEIDYPTYNADTTYNVLGIVTIYKGAPEIFPIYIAEYDPGFTFYVLKATEGENWNLSTGERIAEFENFYAGNDSVTILKLEDFVLPAVNGSLGYFTFTTELAPNDTDWTSIDQYRLGPVGNSVNFNANEYVMTSFDADKSNDYDINELNSDCLIEINGNANFIELTAGTYDLYILMEFNYVQDQYIDLHSVGERMRLYIVNPNATGVYEIPNMATVTSVKYYNLNGVETAEPTDGVNIRVTTYSNGTRTATKILK